MRLPLLLAAAVTMTAGCGDAREESLPPVPPVLIYRDELPFGDAVSARLTRASNAVRDILEPHWGRLEGRIYLLPADARDGFVRQISAHPPAGWTLDPETPPLPADATLMSYRKKDRIFAFLLVSGVPGEYLPVEILHN